ncbi:MAG: hypothetical protein P9L88_00455 [Candidatus Tantalella remota]|nr:hypothetical protein [Candidatus Tantalella remota]
MNKGIRYIEKLEELWGRKLSRKDFLKGAAAAGLTFAASSYIFGIFSKYKAFAAIPEKRGMHEALFYEKMGSEAVQCQLCFNRCTLSNGQRGFCRVREPVDGKLYSMVYELVCAVHVDPIEKKPMYHMLPGSKSFSIATAGCNSRCKYCQNWTISQRPPEETNNRRMSCAGLVSRRRPTGAGL